MSLFSSVSRPNLSLGSFGGRASALHLLTQDDWDVLADLFLGTGSGLPQARSRSVDQFDSSWPGASSNLFVGPGAGGGMFGSDDSDTVIMGNTASLFKMPGFGFPGVGDRNGVPNSFFGPEPDSFAPPPRRPSAVGSSSFDNSGFLPPQARNLFSQPSSSANPFGRSQTRPPSGFSPGAGLDSEDGPPSSFFALINQYRQQEQDQEDQIPLEFQRLVQRYREQDEAQPIRRPPASRPSPFAGLDADDGPPPEFLRLIQSYRSADQRQPTSSRQGDSPLARSLRAISNAGAAVDDQSTGFWRNARIPAAGNRNSSSLTLPPRVRPPSNPAPQAKPNPLTWVLALALLDRFKDSTAES